MGLSLAFASGVTLVLQGAPLPPAPALLPAFLLPILTWRRPALRGRTLGALILGLAAGVVHGQRFERTREADCRVMVRDGQELILEGRVIRGPARGRLTLAVEAGHGLPCRAQVTVLMPRASARALPAADRPGEGGVARPELGEGARAVGRWRRNPGIADPERAGELVAAEVQAAQGPRSDLLLDRRARVESRLAVLYPERHGLVAALILASKDGLDPAFREAFARAGTAHLLAISGFHVGVVAALLLGAVRAVGVRRRRAGVLAALAVWAYVLFIGAPDAAARAALMLSLFAAGALLGRPVSGAGALATAFLTLIVADAGALARPGFQLSFAGAAGLVLLGRGLEERLRRVVRAERARPLLSAVAAGVAATLATLPIVAWHFDQVSLVGILATLLATPLVAAAIPGSFASLAADLVSPALGAFVAGGVDLLLVVLLEVTRVLAALPFAVVFVPRSWTLAGGAGALLAWGALSSARHLGAAVRAAVLASGAAATILVLPLWGRATAAGSIEIVFLDVGQGDAIALRSPGFRWVLVDAGPPSLRGPEPRVLGELRRLGVRRIEALILTHPHLDHIGGAGAVLEALEVGVVLDPGLPSGSTSFVELLEAAEREGAGWRAARRGDRLEIDGLTLEVLHEVDRSLGTPDDANESSVVVLARYGAFEALLTGDAPYAVEEEVVGRSGPFELLKVGHHGSRTSSSRAFLEEARLQAAVISLGRGNRYGHPHQEVLARLQESGASVFRTDRDGTVRVRARPDGTFSVHTGRGVAPAVAGDGRPPGN